MVCVKTDTGAQTETAAQALYPQGVWIKFLSFLYYICLHIDADYFTPCPGSATLDSISVGGVKLQWIPIDLQTHLWFYPKGKKEVIAHL